MSNIAKSLKIILMTALAVSPGVVAKAKTSSISKGSYRGYFKTLGESESHGNYMAINAAGYIGKYQMGEAALMQSGFYNISTGKYSNHWNGSWTKLASQEHVASKEAFLLNKHAQEHAVKIYTQKNWDYIKYYKLNRFIGMEVNGIKITISGMLGGAHLVGVGGLRKFLEDGEDVVDGNGTPVSSYMLKMGGYRTPFDKDILST